MAAITRIPEARSVIDISPIIETLMPPQTPAEIIIDSPLSRKKEEIFSAIDGYNEAFSSQEVGEESNSSIDFIGKRDSKRIIKLTIEKVIQEVGSAITSRYVPVYVKELCSILSRIIGHTLKESIAGGKILVASAYLKYLAEISKTVVLPNLLELDQNIVANEPDLSQYFSGLNANIIGLISSQKATEKETPPFTLSWVGKAAGFIMGVACGSYLVKSLYDVFKSGNIEAITAAATQLPVIKCAGSSIGCLASAMFLSIPYISSENRAVFYIAIEKVRISNSLKAFEDDIREGLNLRPSPVLESATVSQSPLAPSSAEGMS